MRVTMPHRNASRADMNAQGFFPAEPESKVACGVDVGYSGDNSVAVTVERLRLPMDPALPGAVDTQSLEQKLAPPMFIVRGICMFELRTAFGEVIAHLKRIRAALGNDTDILVDCTGQLSFAEMAREAQLDFTQLSITGGGFDQVKFKDGYEAVSKAHLVSQVDACLSARELIVPNDLPNAQTLMSQLSAFQMGRSPITGQPVWGSKRAKDDCVLALSYALHALRERRGLGVRVVPLHHVFS